MELVKCITVRCSINRKLLLHCLDEKHHTLLPSNSCSNCTGMDGATAVTAFPCRPAAIQPSFSRYVSLRLCLITSPLLAV